MFKMTPIIEIKLAEWCSSSLRSAFHFLDCLPLTTWSNFHNTNIKHRRLSIKYINTFELKKKSFVLSITRLYI